MVSRGLKRLQTVQNYIEDLPPPAVLTNRSESSDALSDVSTTDTVVFEENSEVGAEEFPQSPVG